QKMLHAGQQKRAKLARQRAHVRQRISFEEGVKESLSQILGVVTAKTGTTNKRIQRIPIGRTQISQRLCTCSPIPCASSEYDSPMRRVKSHRFGGKIWARCCSRGHASTL